ncbi:serine/threonine-protein kinase [Acidobacteria bacterium AH-259-D05]|nr:serine/threonine-protein kinase [Acidobacteria bacterium AH-259-D05]
MGRRTIVGKTISHYKVIEKIGQGGMGEVYLAEDSRLERKVALKILPQHLSERADLRERFEREARAVSSLNHPHICTLYDIGEQDGIHYLVMEHLEGETLAARLEKGALPLEQTLEYAIQIADALDKAHRQGVVHRDLKPGNIMLTKSGAKLLDFGLAKLRATEAPQENLSALPTEQANLTAEGTILGTLQYMAPEQLEGKETDSRTDIFAFGAVVYEMATGKKAFEGKSQASLIAAIMEKDPPPITSLQEMTPPSLDHVVKRCLTKEPENRWQTAYDVMKELQWVVEGGSQPGIPAPVVAQRKNRERLAWGLVSALAVGIIITLIAVWNLSSPPTPQSVSRFAMVLPTDQQLIFAGRHQVAFSPDGKHLVYVANRQLYLRAMDQLEARPIRGTEEGRSPFFSPDGQWVGFWSGQLKKVSISGGAPVTLCEAVNPWGASWGADDSILFGQGSEGIFQVSAAGGTKELLISVDSTKSEEGHGPQLLPGGRAVLFTLGSGGSWDEAQILVQSLETGERKVLINGGTDGRYVPTGHLVYAREGTLLAVSFDLARLEVTGSAVPIAEGVTQAFSNFTGAAHFSFSGLGSLVYVPGITGEIVRTLLWVDRGGQEEPLAADRLYLNPRFSPDGTHVAVGVGGASADDVWIYDLTRKTLTRLTFSGDNSYPLWTPDGLQVVFASRRDGGQFNLFWKAADGTGQVERLTTSPNRQSPYFFSPDGKSLVFQEEVEGSWDLHVLSMEGEPTVQPLLQTEFTELYPAISPDGRWMAYQSVESGRYEIYVRPFPKVEEGKWQISSEGGSEPVWGPDGQELFYRAGDRMMVVPIQTEPAFMAGNPAVLFDGRYVNDPGQDYDIFPDGQRFLMIKAGGQTEETSARTELIIVLNWFEELKRLVPTDN